MRITKKFGLLMVLFVLWLVLVEDLSALNLIFAIIISIVISYIDGVFLNPDNIELMRTKNLIKYIIFILVVLTHVYKALYYYALSIISGVTNEDIVTIYLDNIGAFNHFMIAVAITLTPGTVSVNLVNNQLEVLILDVHRDSKGLIKNVKQYEEILK